MSKASSAGTRATTTAKGNSQNGETPRRGGRPPVVSDLKSAKAADRKRLLDAYATARKRGEPRAFDLVPTLVEGEFASLNIDPNGRLFLGSVPVVM